MEVVNPVVTVRADPGRLAPRRASLRGCRIGVLDNSKPNAGVVLERIAELIVERQGAASFRRWTKPGSSRAAASIEEIRSASDVVLTGSAD